MFADMTPGSYPTVSTKGFERRRPYRNQRLRSEKIFSGSKDQKNPKSPSSRNCLNCFFKEAKQAVITGRLCGSEQDRARMEPRDTLRSSQATVNQGKLRELASKWFIETQVPLIVHNGLFPNWFLGFITRKDAEEILREREPGCFLVRLSDKAIGYILSYKGKDRCRHFVINQNEDGQFIVSGDNGGHDTVSKLIEFYMSSPFEPFGEFLTSSCSEVLNEELYDTVQICPKEPVSSVRTAINVPKQQIDLPSERTRTHPPPSSRTREGVPPPPQRSRHFVTSPVHGQDSVLYAQIRKQPSRDKLRSQHVFQGHLPGDHQGRPQRPTAQKKTVIQLTPPSGRGSSPESHSSDGKNCHRLRTPPHTPPKVSPKPVRDGTRNHPQPDPCGRDHAVYHLAGISHPAVSVHGSRTPEQSGEPLYAEVPGVALFGHLSGDISYELLPAHEGPAHPKTSDNTYEPAEDLKAKALKSYIRKWAKWKW